MFGCLGVVLARQRTRLDRGESAAPEWCAIGNCRVAVYGCLYRMRVCTVCTVQTMYRDAADYRLLILVDAEIPALVWECSRDVSIHEPFEFRIPLIL